MTSLSGRYSISGGYSILLADDHEMFRREVRKMLEEIPDLKVVGEAADGDELFDLLRKFPPDLVIMDISMPRCRALEATRKIKGEYPGVKVLIMIMEQAQEYLAQATAAGAEGCLLKQDLGVQLTAAIDAIRRGEKFPGMETRV